MSLDYKYINQVTEAISPPKTFLKKIRFLFRNKALDFLSSIKLNNEKSFMRTICCHNVFDDQVEDFEKLILELKNIGDFVNTETCNDILDNKKTIDGKYFHLSF